MKRWEPEEPDDEEDGAEQHTAFPRFAATVTALLLVVVAALVAGAIAVAAAAAAGAASVIARWTGLGAGHVLAGILVFSSLLVVVWRTGKLASEIRLARDDAWRIARLRESELEALHEALERAADDRGVHESSPVRAETTARKRGRRERSR